MHWRLTLATLFLAVFAAAMALWPVVADAPWEDESVVQPTPIRACDSLWEQFTQARTNAIANGIKSEMERSRCPQDIPRIPQSQSEIRPLEPIRLEPLQPIRIEPIRPIVLR